MSNAGENSGVLVDITRHLAGIFRHMLPGVLLVSGAAVAYPDWFANLDLKSWSHLALLTVISVAAGNTWFAFNRYGFHQFVDYILWCFGSKSPAKTSESVSYIDDIGLYAQKSLHTPESSARAREHVAFRASTVLLILTVGEICCVFSFFHAKNSIFEGRGILLFFLGAFALLIGGYQMAITRRIDHYIVNPPSR